MIKIFSHCQLYACFPKMDCEYKYPGTAWITQAAKVYLGVQAQKSVCGPGRLLLAGDKKHSYEIHYIQRIFNDWYFCDAIQS